MLETAFTGAGSKAVVKNGRLILDSSHRPAGGGGRAPQIDADMNMDGESGPCTEGATCIANSGQQGRCHNGACCGGCWNGSGCVNGTASTECGNGGVGCIDCRSIVGGAEGNCTNDASCAGGASMHYFVIVSCNAGNCGYGAPACCATGCNTLGCL